MKGKRLLAALMASAMALGMTACGGSGGGTSNSGGGAGGNSSASDFPSKSVTIIMPWSLGGGPDTIARQVASYGDKYLGVPVIVENKTGGAGTIAMNAALQAADDGYTMVVANGPLFSLTPSFQNVNYTLDDITPLIGMRATEFVVLTNAKSGLSSIDDLKAYAAKGNTIKYATTGGPGNDSYTMISVLFKKLGLPAEAIPYDGGQDAINALSGGHVDVAIGSPRFTVTTSSTASSTALAPLFRTALTLTASATSHPSRIRASTLNSPAWTTSQSAPAYLTTQRLS